ncbi:MAG: DUF721 domain-containing protein [Bacteroidales bacterium]|nr:DUF721 domain-containing protein [Bacteroidales bacterium]MBR3030908.1 DUF721 domain-containing protein [Bacteroidales bacterium]
MRKQQSVLIGDILGEYIPRDSALGKGLLTAKVRQAYNQAVGSSAAAATMGVTFKDGTLRCRISSSVYRMHLTSVKDEILQSINGILGKEEVKSLIFT